MTPAGCILRQEIARSGPIPFRRFMEVALYHPEHGYYRRGRDPFGKAGDYYTAEQVQPVFGTLIASCLRSLRSEMGNPPDFAVVELGAGRGEMAEFLSEFAYRAVEIGGAMPDRICGVVFANEFFDALPVHVVVKRGGEFREMRIGFENGRFHWVEGGPAAEKIRLYLERYAAPSHEGALLEVNLDALAWVEEISERLERGYVFVIDYGYTAAEIVRFPAGTLMSYRRHLASGDVLADPGDRDITAHVCFTALQEHASIHNLRTVRFESLARALLRAGEPDQFAAALAGVSDMEILKRRLQLKSLLFGMGETFRTLLARKRVQSKAPQNKNGPEYSGP